MILLLAIALSCIITAGYLVFALPGNQHAQARDHITGALAVGIRVKTYAGDVGTIHTISGQHLTIFFDDGNRKIVLPEHIAMVL